MSRILVVEDDRANRRLAQLVLEEAGYFVRTVDDGETAMEVLGMEDFDVILLDIMMPGVSGFEVSQWVRGSQTVNADRPIIAVTAYTREFGRSKFEAAGFNFVLDKPYGVEDLKGVVATHLA